MDPLPRKPSNEGVKMNKREDSFAYFSSKSMADLNHVSEDVKPERAKSSNNKF